MSRTLPRNSYSERVIHKFYENYRTNITSNLSDYINFELIILMIEIIIENKFSIFLFY